MSLAFSRDATLLQNKNDLAQTLQSRKRKLRQLYAVATAETFPPSFDLEPKARPGLANFLDQNDIQKGRYFDVSTLPSRPQNAPGFHPLSPTPSLPSNSLTGSHDIAQREAIHGSSNLSLSSPAADHSQTDASDTLSEHDMTRRTRSRKAGAHSDADQALESHEAVVASTPKQHGSDPSLSRSSRLQKKASRNTSEQPELTTGDEIQQVGTEEQATKLNDLQDPSKTTSRRSGLRDRSAEPKNGPVTAETIKDTRASSRTREDERTRNEEHGDIAADVPTSPSSTAEPKSTNTSGGDVHSPATSPDDEGHATTEPPSTTPQVVISFQHGLDLDDKADATTQAAGVSNQSGVLPTSRKRPASPSLESKEGSSNTQPHKDSAPPSKKVKTSELVLEESGVATTPGPTFADTQVPVDRAITSGENANAGAATSKQKRQSLTPVSTNVAARPNASRVTKSKYKHKSNVPSLVFSNQVSDKFAEVVKSLQDDHLAMDGRLGPANKDYMQIMFLRQALNTSFHGDLTKLLNASAKALTTSDWIASLREEQDCRIVKQIYKFQDRNRWSYRQLEPASEPDVPKVHQDFLLGEMKWLQTDFREERKFKLYMARRLADWCAEWVGADSEKRISLQVMAREPLRAESTAEAENRAEQDRSANTASIDNLERSDNEIDPTPIFSSGPDEVPLDVSEATLGEQAIKNIPLFLPSDLSRQSKGPSGPSASLSTQLLQQTAEAAKQSSEDQSTELPPEDTSCALFDPEWKPLRSRVNANYAFRPPPTSMPPQGFYEYRYPSQWTYEDDQQLRGYVKDFPSNWALISDRMSLKSNFIPGHDRRTPWECYERLLGIEGPPTDNNTRQYLRYFQYRMEQARRSFHTSQVALQQHAQAQAQSSGQSVPQIPQKRFPSPVKVERRPSRRFIAMLDAARRLAKKRETKELSQTRQQQQQQQQQAQQAQQNQQQGASQNPTGQREIKTPQQFSRMKHEKELRDQQKLEQYRAQQRAFEMQRRQQQSANQTLPPNGIAQQMRNNGTGVANGVNAAGHLAVPNTNQARPVSQSSSAQGQVGNTATSNNAMGVNGRPQATMQGAPRITAQANGQPMSQEGIQRLMQQQQQQQQVQQQQQRMQMQNQTSLQNTGQMGSNSPSTGNATMLAFNGQQVPNGDGLQSPNMLQPSLNGSSPNMSQQYLASQQQGNRTSQPQTLSSGHTPTVQTLMHDIQRSNPNMTAVEVSRQAAEQLKNFFSRQSRQNAINAAAGLPHQNTANAMQGSQSPFMQGSNASQNSPYQQNSMLASNQQSGSSVSPVVPPMSSHGSNTGYQNQQGQYQQQLRNQMLNQQHQRQNMMSPNLGSMGSPNTTAANLNPMMDMSLGGYGGGTGNNSMGRTSTPNQNMSGGQSMRPPSRTSIDPTLQQQQGQQQGRPGSAQAQMSTPRLASQSPRPVSAQGQA